MQLLTPDPMQSRSNYGGFYQSLLNCANYTLDLGVAKICMGPVLNGQPIQFLCKTTDGRYLRSFQIWHKDLLLPLNSQIEKEATKPSKKGL